ncbi:MAG: C4-dicarboxylate ABC transporter substrate-binding protein, partial [Betaproteobacteria bacterium]
MSSSGGHMNRFTAMCAALGIAATASVANAQTKWDMPTGYAPGNFHTENVRQFAADV